MAIKLVKEREGIDRKDWYDAAIRSLDWVLAQQNEDGGFPQCVDIDTGEKSISVVSGCTMVGLPIISKITGDDRYLKKALEAEKFLREKVENRFWYTGMHLDLPPEDFEQDSFFAIVEYWLDKYDRTGEQEALEHAVANAYLGLLSWLSETVKLGEESDTRGFVRATELQSVFCVFLRQPQVAML